MVLLFCAVTERLRELHFLCFGRFLKVILLSPGVFSQAVHPVTWDVTSGDTLSTL